jgi:hypothetical protein
MSKETKSFEVTDISGDVVISYGVKEYTNYNVIPEVWNLEVGDSYKNPNFGGLLIVTRVK